MKILNENWIEFLVDLGQLDKEYFPKYFWAFFHGFEDKPQQRSCINDDEIIDGMIGLNPHGSDEWI
jgi:hypothetical protein